MKNLKPEMIEKAKEAKSAEELLELAKENNLYRQNYCGCEFALKVQQQEAPESLKKVY